MSCHGIAFTCCISNEFEKFKLSKVTVVRTEIRLSPSENPPRVEGQNFFVPCRNLELTTCWKGMEVPYQVGVLSLLGFCWDEGSIAEFGQLTKSVQKPKFSAAFPTSRDHCSWTVHRIKACKYPLERYRNYLRFLCSLFLPVLQRFLVVSSFALTARFGQILFNLLKAVFANFGCWGFVSCGCRCPMDEM